MNQEEVRNLSKEFLAALTEEKKIRAELLDLQMHGDDDHIKREFKKHDALLKRIDQIRNERMLPIMRTLIDFVAERQGVKRSPRDRMLEAIKSGRRKVRRGQLKPGMIARKRKRKKPRPEALMAGLAAAS